MTDEHVTALPILEEQLRVEKTRIKTGRVKVRTETETVEETAKASLLGEAVEVTRVPVDRTVDQAPPVRTEGDVTIIPVVEEVLFVEKRLVLKEELHVRKRMTEEHVEVPVTLRKQHAVVERFDESVPKANEEGDLQ